MRDEIEYGAECSKNITVQVNNITKRNNSLNMGRDTEEW